MNHENPNDSLNKATEKLSNKLDHTEHIIDHNTKLLKITVFLGVILLIVETIFAFIN